MKEITIHSFEELQDVIFANCFDKKTMRFRDNYVYRGVENKDYTLTTKLNRICNHDISLEGPIIRSFKKYGYADLKNVDSYWQILALGQHYGLPTRLLDWSYSPLVAAHFATEDIYEYDKDGAIFCIDMSTSYKNLPTCLKEELDMTRTQSFTVGMLDRHAKDLSEFKELSTKPYFLFYEPASQTDRMANQYALFSVVSDPKYTIDELLDQEDVDCMFKIIIPKEIKLEIRDKLDYINISERLIYPGLDGICSWITRRYADLGPRYNKHMLDDVKDDE